MADKSKHVELPARFIDPIEPGEPKFALFSFIPAPNAKCDERGFYGVAKMRGAFHTYAEASKRAEEIVKHYDSSANIFTQMIGHPFPLVVKGHADELHEVEIAEKVEATLRDNDREQKLKDKRTMQELKEREEALLRDVDPDIPGDPKEIYLEQRVKLAHLTHHIKTLRKQIDESLVKRENCRLRLIRMNDENGGELEDDYVERYMKARRNAKIPENTDTTGFMQHLRDDLEEKLE